MIIDIYSANTEKQLVSVFNEVTTILSTFENTDNYNVAFTGNLNLSFYTSLGTNDGTPKSQSINKLVE